MNEDFREFFALLNTRGVEFLVIGGVAYNYYAPPRSTKRTHGNYGDVQIAILSRRDLIECKKTVGRPRDLADAAMLEEIERLAGENPTD